MSALSELSNVLSMLILTHAFSNIFVTMCLLRVSLLLLHLSFFFIKLHACKCMKINLFSIYLPFMLWTALFNYSQNSFKLTFNPKNLLNLFAYSTLFIVTFDAFVFLFPLKPARLNGCECLSPICITLFISVHYLLKFSIFMHWCIIYWNSTR